MPNMISQIVCGKSVRVLDIDHAHVESGKGPRNPRALAFDLDCRLGYPSGLSVSSSRRDELKTAATPAAGRLEGVGSNAEAHAPKGRHDTVTLGLTPRPSYR